MKEDFLENGAEVVSLFCRLYINTKKELPIRSSHMGLLIFTVKSQTPVTPIGAVKFFKVKKPMITAMVTSLEKSGIRLVSFLSLIGVENNPVPPHHKIEKYIQQAGLPYCHIRPSFFMQNISGVHAFEIKYFDRIVVPVKRALTSFIDAEDIGELTAKVLSEPEKHQNRGYSITGPEAIDYFQVEKILSEELGRPIAYANPKPSLAKKYWIGLRGLDKEYATVMGMLYMMTRMGAAKEVTATFEAIMEKKPQTFRQFARKNLAAWKREEN